MSELAPYQCELPSFGTEWRPCLYSNHVEQHVSMGSGKSWLAVGETIIFFSAQIKASAHVIKQYVELFKRQILMLLKSYIKSKRLGPDEKYKGASPK